jgi:hypothetical protein
VYRGYLNAETKSFETYAVVRGLVRALGPIAHGEPPERKAQEQQGLRAKRSNIRSVRKMTVNCNGVFVEVPIVSAVQMAHICRALMVRDLLAQAGCGEGKLAALRDAQPKVYHVLFSGGHMGTKAKENGGESPGGADQGRNAKASGKGSRKEKKPKEEASPEVREFLDLVYPVTLFGWADPWAEAPYESVVSVDHLQALTAETVTVGDLLGALRDAFKVGGSFPTAADFQRVKPMRFVRTDERAAAADLHALPAEEDEGLEPVEEGGEPGDQRMIIAVEYVPAGTLFYHEFRVEAGPGTELALSALKYLTEELLPRHPYVGGLIRRGFGKVSFDYRFPEWSGKPVTSEAYRKYVEKNKERVGHLVAQLIAGKAGAAA